MRKKLYFFRTVSGFFFTMPESSSPPPTTLEAVLARLGQMEETLELKTGQFAEELARKDEIIEGLQRRLYGSKSERLDPNQEILEFTDELMGKPEAPTGENTMTGLVIVTPLE